MNGVFPFVLFIGVLLVAVGWMGMKSRRQTRRAHEGLAALARQLGLQLHEKPPRYGLFPQVPAVSGQRGGREVRFYIFTTGSGRHCQQWRAFAVACANPQGLTFRLSTPNGFSRVGERPGLQEVRSGHPEFDERFVVQTNAPDFLRAALRPELLDPLLRYWSAVAPGASLTAEGAGIVYAEPGHFAEAKALARMLALLEPALALAALPEVYRG